MCCLLIGQAEIDLLLIYQALSFARLVMLLMFYCLTFIEAEQLQPSVTPIVTLSGIYTLTQTSLCHLL